MQSLKKIVTLGLIVLGLSFELMMSANAERLFERPPLMSLELILTLGDFETQAEYGDIDAQHTLANTYYTGNYLGEKVRKDRAKAFELYKKAANQGHAESQTNLAIMYREGEVVRQNISEYIKWLKKAASQKETRAQALLGIAYEFGTGVTRNYAVAKEWYGKSCDNGNLDGCQDYKRLNEQGK